MSRLPRAKRQSAYEKKRALEKLLSDAQADQTALAHIARSVRGIKAARQTPEAQSSDRQRVKTTALLAGHAFREIGENEIADDLIALAIAMDDADHGIAHPLTSLVGGSKQTGTGTALFRGACVAAVRTRALLDSIDTKKAAESVYNDLSKLFPEKALAKLFPLNGSGADAPQTEAEVKVRRRAKLEQWRKDFLNERSCGPAAPDKKPGIAWHDFAEWQRLINDREANGLITREFYERVLASLAETARVNVLPLPAEGE